MAMQATAPSWRPISEAPKDGTEVITYCPIRGEWSRQITLNLFAAGRWIRSDSDHQPTLFLPLPPLPTERQSP